VTASSVQRLVIDLNSKSATVTLDGTVADLAIADEIRITSPGLATVVNLKGTIKTTGGAGQITLNAPTTLTGATTLDASFVGVNRVINGAQALTIAGTTLAQGADIGGTIPLASLAVNVATAQLAGSITTTGVQTWSGSTGVLLDDADVALHASRVVQSGTVECSGCTAERALAVDVSSTSPASTVTALGSQVGADGQTFRLVKDGIGTLTLAATLNKQDGGLVVNGGTARVTESRELSDGPLYVGAAGTLELAGGISTNQYSGYIPSSFALAGTLLSTGSTNTMGVPITLIGDATLRALSGAPLDVASYTAGGTHNLTLEGPVDLQAQVATTGSLRVAAMSMWLPEQSLDTTGMLVLDGILELHAQNLTLGASAISGSGQIRCASPGGAYSCGQLT